MIAGCGRIGKGEGVKETTLQQSEHRLNRGTKAEFNDIRHKA